MEAVAEGRLGWRVVDLLAGADMEQRYLRKVLAVDSMVHSDLEYLKKESKLMFFSVY